MDLLFQFLVSLVVLICVAPLILVLSNYDYKQKSMREKLPKGKTGWPILGETPQFLLSGRRGQFEKFVLDRMKLYGSPADEEIFTTSLFGDHVAFFCGASGNKFLFSNENKLVVSWVPRSINKILFSDTSVNSHASIAVEGKRFRSILWGFLKLDALQNYISTMDIVAKQEISEEWAPNNKEVDVVVNKLAKKYTFGLACRLLLGIKETKHVAKLTDHFGTLAAGLFSVPIDFPGTRFNRAIKAARFLRKELLEIIKEKRLSLLQQEEKSSTMNIIPDLLSHLFLTPDENGKITSEVLIVDELMGLLIAGYDTAAITITFVINYLADFPHVYQEVLKEQMEIAKSKGPDELLNWVDVQKMKYTWNVACEALRLAPPTPVGFKETLTDFTFAGFTIPKGLKLCWSVHSTHKNPKYFPNPEKFDPTRFQGNGPAPYTFVPFGGGPRMCPGKEYARLEILVLIHNLVTKFKWEKLIPNERISFVPTPILEKGLPITLFPH